MNDWLRFKAVMRKIVGTRLTYAGSLPVRSLS